VGQPVSDSSALLEATLTSGAGEVAGPAPAGCGNLGELAAPAAATHVWWDDSTGRLASDPTRGNRQCDFQIATESATYAPADTCVLRKHS
jgi:hypothetical protein